MSDTLYDATTLAAVLTIIGILVKAICANNKTTLTKIIMCIITLALIALFFFMVVDININES